MADDPSSGSAPADPPPPRADQPAADPTTRLSRRYAGRRRARRKAPWWELPLLVLLAVVVAIAVKTFVVQPFYIPSQSMEKTLHGCPTCRGDRILVNKPIYDVRDPHPGDIVVFHAPQGWDDEPASNPPSNPVLRVLRGFGQLIGFVPPDGQVLVKRVIATAGQTVKGEAGGKILISTHGAGGPFRALNEPFVFIDSGAASGIEAFGPVTVPNGRLWVMGDHRNDSADSRYHCGPDGTMGSLRGCQHFASQATVPVGDVIGKAFVIAWPPSRWRTLGTPSTFSATAGPLRVLPAAVAAPALALGLVVPIRLRRRHRRRRAGPRGGLRGRCRGGSGGGDRGGTVGAGHLARSPAGRHRSVG